MSGSLRDIECEGLPKISDLHVEFIHFLSNFTTSGSLAVKIVGRAL